MAQQKYTIIEKIDAGGMAEVWKGLATSLRGFEKLVAIKRVLPNLAKNKQFISMFLDEARLSLYLNHANVVQTFDIGLSDSAYFIVMEWVDGVNLKAILDRTRQRNIRMAREQAAYIALEICKGLSHAHNRKDPKGKPLNIVHRDISPPNVLMSREGEVKLVDFGLAKAQSQISATDPGVVKGKFGYLCPEATRGETVDHRADIFAAGIVLWEMLAGRRLFDGETDLRTVELVRETRIPPITDFNEQCEPQLQAILQKALARDPKDRFQSAEELGHEIARYLFENRLLVTSYDIAVLVKRVLSEKTAVPRREPKLSSGVEAIKAELGAFRSVEDLDRLEFVSVAETEGHDADAPKSGDAMDPRAWALEMGVVTGDETILDVPPTEEELEAARSLPAQSSVEMLPNGSRKVSITGPPDSNLPSLPSPTPTPRPQLEAIKTPMPPGPGALPAHVGTGERRARAEAAAAAARQAQTHGRAAEPSNAMGVVIGLLGAGAIIAAAWFFLLR